MSGNRCRRLGAGLARSLALAFLAVLLLATAAVGAVLWTLVAVPLTANQGQATTFSLTATDLIGSSEDVGCVRVTLGSAFSVSGAAISSVSNGGTWLATHTATSATVHSQDGGDRLGVLGSVTFTITATPQLAGVLTWSAIAYAQQDCSGPTGSSTVVVTVLAGAPTPTPTPTSTPTPAPSASSTPKVTSSPGGSVAPTASPSPSGPSSTAGQVSPTPAIVAGSSPPDSPQPAPGAGGSGAASGPGPGGPGGAPPGSSSSAYRLVAAGTGSGPGGLAASVGGLALGSAWIVPAAAIGGPGLLVLLWLALQLVAGIAWLPAGRGVRGEPPPQPIGVVRSQPSRRLRTSARK